MAILPMFTLRAVTLGPGETLDWDANKPTAADVVEATGGTIVFNSSVTVANNIHLGGEVSVVINNGASVRFTKTFFKTNPSGRLVLPCAVRFGSDDSSRFAFLPENSIAFTSDAAGSRLRFAGYVSMAVLPDGWTSPVAYECESDTMIAFYGADMVTDDVYAVPSGCTVRMTSPANFSASTVISVPADSTLQDRPSKFDPVTCAGSGIDTDTVTVGSNDVVLAGGTFKILTGSTHHYFGDISGTGMINVGTQYPSEYKSRNVYHYFYGDLSEMDAQSELTIDELRETNPAMNQGARLNSDFPGKVKINFVTSNWIDPNGKYCVASNTVSFGFAVPGGSGVTNESWHVGALQGGSFIGVREGEGGARLQFSARQHIHVGTLSGKLTAYATGLSSALNTDDLTVDTVSDDTILYVKNGIRFHFGTVGKGVKIRYMASPVSSNVVEIGSGAIEEIAFLSDQRAKPVYLNGGAVEKITGSGTIIVTGGNVRIGAADATVDVQVRGGTVTFGSGADLGGVLGGRPALWLDASDTEKMTGAYNSGWAETQEGRLVLGTNPAVTFNGSAAATYTNGFPLIEKWFDKRPEQTWTYAWQDRCADYSSTLYTLVYPYLVPKGLNGRAYLSFGKHGSEDLPVEFGRGRADNMPNFRREMRRMPLMHDMLDGQPRGNAVSAYATILVFGSQQGGGRAILGSYDGNDRWKIGGDNPGCGANYLRGGDNYDATNTIFAPGNNKSAWIDGENIDPAATPLNGGWQIISVTNPPAAWRSLGEGAMKTDASESGGQNYAEVISFTNAITAAERMAVENYLAMKWGLPGALSAKCSVTVSAGALVKGAIANVTGAGTWEFDLPESRVKMNGSFKGTVSGSGDIAVADAADLPAIAESFNGAVEVLSGNLSFECLNGAISSALIAANSDLTFPSAATVEISAVGTKPAVGDHVLVQGKTLTGMTDLSLVHNVSGGRILQLVRAETSLVLRVIPSGTTIIVR